MSGIRLLLAVALPLGTALLGFLILFSRRRGKGKDDAAIGDTVSRQGGGDNEGVNVRKRRTENANVVGQSREGHKTDLTNRDHDNSVQTCTATCTVSLPSSSHPERSLSKTTSSSHTGVTANHSTANNAVTASSNTPLKTGVKVSSESTSSTHVTSTASHISTSNIGDIAIKDSSKKDIQEIPINNSEVKLNKVSGSKSVSGKTDYQTEPILSVDTPPHLSTSSDRKHFQNRDGANENADHVDLQTGRISALLPDKNSKSVPKSSQDSRSRLDIDPASSAVGGHMSKDKVSTVSAVQTSVNAEVGVESVANHSHVVDEEVGVESVANHSHVVDAEVGVESVANHSQVVDAEHVSVLESVGVESNGSGTRSQSEEVSPSESAAVESGANQREALDTACVEESRVAMEISPVIHGASSHPVSHSGMGDGLNETQTDVSDTKPDCASSGTTDKHSSSDKQTDQKSLLEVDVSAKVAASSNGADATSATSSSNHVADHSDNTAAAAVTVVTGNSESPGCDSNSEASNDSGRGGSVTELLPLAVSPPDSARYEFNFPSELCGRLIGKNGRNINQVKEKSGANITLKNNPCTPNFQICVIEGLQVEVDKALGQIQRKFPRHQFPQVDFTPLSQVLPETPVLMPDIMQVVQEILILMPSIVQLNLPEGVSVDIVVSNIVDAGHLFVQQPTHPTFPSLERLNHFMNLCYTQDRMVPPLPSPVEVGVICASFMVDGWFRAQVVSVAEGSTDVDVKYVDYGGYSRVPASSLKQIRSDFMTLPFQAVECYMGNVTPLQEEEFFNDQGSSVLEELTQGKMLQAQVVNRAEDGIPYIHMYQISGNRVLFINREMVNRKVVRWIEILQ